MRSGFTDREEALEKNFQHDKELSFKIKSRRNHLFGYWVGREMDLKDSDLEVYAASFIDFSIKNADDTALIEKTLKDFLGRGVAYTRHQIEKQLRYCQDDARQELKPGK